MAQIKSKPQRRKFNIIKEYSIELNNTFQTESDSSTRRFLATLPTDAAGDNAQDAPFARRVNKSLHELVARERPRPRGRDVS